MKRKTGILVVGFDVADGEKEKQAIGVLTKEIAASYGDVSIYQAGISGRISKAPEMQKESGLDKIGRVMEQMAKEGVTNVILQPYVLIPGMVYDLIQQKASAYRDIFEGVLIGRPLLVSQEDCSRAARCVMQQYKKLDDGEGLVWIGHGTGHTANRIYLWMDQAFCEMGSHRVRMATLKAHPGFEDIVEWVMDRNIKKVHLASFLLTAGSHANRDIAGQEESSWRMRLMELGYQVECHTQGLGGYPGIRKMFLEHLCGVMEGLECEEQLH